MHNIFVHLLHVTMQATLSNIRGSNPLSPRLATIIITNMFVQIVFISHQVLLQYLWKDFYICHKYYMHSGQNLTKDGICSYLWSCYWKPLHPLLGLVVCGETGQRGHLEYYVAKLGVVAGRLLYYEEVAVEVGVDLYVLHPPLLRRHLRQQLQLQHPTPAENVQKVVSCLLQHKQTNSQRRHSIISCLVWWEWTFHFINK